jgi:peptidoglycan/LPS O-acetylase OafA/YrhL
VGVTDGTRGPRLEVLDGLRFAAAMAVVAYHYTTMDRVWHRRTAEIFPAQAAAYGWLGVHLFFLISGFVIGMSGWGRGAGAFLVSRAVRLYPAYWLSVLVAAAVATFWPYLHPPPGVSATLVNLTMFQEAVGVAPVAEVYWTLWAELRFYLLFSLLVWWGPTRRRVTGFCVAWLGAATVAKAAVPGGTLLHVVLMTDHAPLFAGGLGCCLVHRFGPSLLSWGIVAYSFALSVPAVLYRAGLEATPGYPTPPRWLAVVLLGACFAVLAAVALGWLRRVRGRALVVLGALTYPLYLLHLEVGGPVLYHWQWTVPPALLVAVVTAAVLVLAWLVHRYVERPVSTLLRRALGSAVADVAADGTAVGRGGGPVLSGRGGTGRRGR